MSAPEDHFEPEDMPHHLGGARVYEFGDKVICDGDTGNQMVVTGLLFRRDAPTEVECSYWINGDHKTVWLPAWRLSGPTN